MAFIVKTINKRGIYYLDKMQSLLMLHSKWYTLLPLDFKRLVVYESEKHYLVKYS
jgi:hypothetical protein